uniref:Uncharacterized protein n=1 Tax=Tanacetum cinerariifolium TaxID=118510 RepID=A0A6L2K790_TANCI|nr:hypothetical protein [Tanacetum cinerariifolium]
MPTKDWKSNFRLRSDIKSKESTLQVVYDVLKLTPFYKAFLFTTDVPTIYMQEFWATTTVYHHSICFKMNNKKHIVNLEYFREMLQICPRLPNQPFDELPFEEEILAFLKELGHSGEIKKITDVNINKLHQPWRSFAAVINKFLSGKNIGAEPPKIKASVRKTQSISNTTVPLPTDKGTRLKILAKGKQPDEGSGIIPGVLDVPTYESDNGKISWKSSEDDDDDDDVQLSEHDEDVDDQSDDESQDDQEDDDDDQIDSDNDGDEFVHPKFSTHDEESFDPIVRTPFQVEKSDDEGKDDDSHGKNVQGDEGPDAEDNDNELYGDLNINLEGRDIRMVNVHTTQVIEDIHVTLNPVNPDGQQQSSSVSSQFVLNMLNPRPDTGVDFIFDLTLRVDVQVTTTVEPPLLSATTLPPPSPIMSQLQQTPAPSPTTLPKVNFPEFMQTNQFAEDVSSIPGIVNKYIDHRMNEAVKVAVQLPSNRLRDEAQAENEDFISKLDVNIQKIIKEQVKVQVSKILPKIEKSVNEQLEAKVLTRASNSSKTSYAVAADLSELELKKILIKKMESNKSIHISDEQKNLYKALVDAYESTYGRIQPWISNLEKKADSRTSFDEMMDTPVDFLAFVMNRLKVDTLTPELLAGPTYELMKGSCKSLVELEFFLEKVYKATTDQLDCNNPEGQQYPHDLLKPLPLIPNSQGHHVIPFDHFINNDLEYLRGGASSRKYTTSVTMIKAADYGHIKWIEDLNVHEKHHHPTTCGRSSIRCRKLPKKLNLTKPNTYRTDLKRKEAYTAYSIQEDSSIRIKTSRTGNSDEVFASDYLERSNKDRAAAMIQAIDKQLKTRRIIRSLEKFVGDNEGLWYEFAKLEASMKWRNGPCGVVARNEQQRGTWLVLWPSIELKVLIDEVELSWRSVVVPAVPATKNSPAVPEHTTVETLQTMSPKNKVHYESEKEAIHLILTGIGDDIYLNVDAYKTTQETWEVIERLQQGESLNI